MKIGDRVDSAVFHLDAFVYEKKKWDRAFRNEYLLEGPATLDTVENAVALPLREIEGSKLKYGDGLFAGGISDSNFNFIAGLRRSAGKSDVNRNCTSSYEVAEDDLEFRDESVIFGGVVMRHFGHMLCDGTTRLWYPATHPEDRRKVIFVMYPREKEPFFDILELAGISRDRVEVILKPTRFAEVTIPGETVHSLGECGYKREWRELLSRMRQNVEPSPHKKIYYTRTKFEGSGCVGEEYFEDFYSSNGFTVVSPETLPIKEQVSLMAGADEVVTTMGTTAIQSIFTRPGARFTVLNRSKTVVKSVILSLHAAQSRAAFVDVYKSFLPEQQAGRCVYLLAPTPHWNEYLKKERQLQVQPGEYPIEANIYKYLLEWGERYKTENKFQWIKNETVPGVARRINQYFFDRKIDTAKYPLPTAWQKALDENAKLQQEVVSLKEQLSSAKSKAQASALAEVECSESGIGFRAFLDYPGIDSEGLSASFHVWDVAADMVSCDAEAELAADVARTLSAHAWLSFEELSIFLGEGRIASVVAAVRVVGPSFEVELPLGVFSRHVGDIACGGAGVIRLGSIEADDGILFQIASLEDWLSVTGECHLESFEWQSDKAKIKGVLLHPLANHPGASLHLIAKGDSDFVSIVGASAVQRRGDMAEWCFDLDPAKLCRDASFEKCIFDFGFEIGDLHQRMNFGRKRPVGTMALAKAVQPEIGNSKIVVIEDDEKSLGLAVRPLVAAKAPRITSIEWADGTLDVKGEFAHPVLLDHPNASFALRACGPKGDAYRIDCSAAFASKGTIAWSVVLNFDAVFAALGEVVGEYHLRYIVGRGSERGNAVSSDNFDTGKFEADAGVLEFPFGLRRPKGTLDKYKAGKFSKGGFVYQPKRLGDKSLGFAVKKVAEKTQGPKKTGETAKGRSFPRRILSFAKRKAGLQ